MDTFCGHFGHFGQPINRSNLNPTWMKMSQEIRIIAPMDTQFSHQIKLSAEALLYAEAVNLSTSSVPFKSDIENPKVIANVLSLCIKRIKQIDSEIEIDSDARDFWVDVFWYIAELNKIKKNY